MPRSTGLLIALWLLAGQAALLCGCAAVTADSAPPSRYLAERHGDVLTTAKLSNAANEVLRIVGLEDCQEAPAACRERLVDAPGLTQEQRLSALSELWLKAAMVAEAGLAGSGPTDTQDAALDAWIESARHAWAYLFFTERQPAERAFEERQMQVCDYYNFAVQRTVERLFQKHANEAASTDREDRVIAGWHIRLQAQRLVQPRERGPEELFAASSFRFSGLRNTYRRGGFGAALVARLKPAPEQEQEEVPFEESRYPVGTATLRFEGANAAEVLATRSVALDLYDPYRISHVTLAGHDVPLAANFTAGYGLWLARSGFAAQALRSFFGMDEGIVRPRIHLMQPYDPDRGVVIMLHGLASSPEAWVNVANEVLGDEVLRQNYQIWQVYYPTNAHVLLNLYTIRQAILQTMAHFDPGGRALASTDVVLVGHSMGGVLARLLVSNSGDLVWQALPAQVDDLRDTDEGLRRTLGKYVEFEALPQVERAVFIAAPHGGTPFAAGRLARMVSDLMALPKAMQEQIAGVRNAAPAAATSGGGEALPKILNSVDLLSDRNPVALALARLPIDPRVHYHSIIAREDDEGDLASSVDGVVPYASAHVAGAESELVIVSSHSVQENPKAILEVRRILHLDLQQRHAARAPVVQGGAGAALAGH